MNIVLLAGSFIVSFLLISLSQYFFLIRKRFDDFNHRSSHNTLATRTGGIGVFSALFVVAVFHYILKIELFDYSLLLPLGVLFLLGVYDDLYHADFRLKFLMQIIIAKMVIDQGFVIDSLHGFVGINEVPWILAQIFTVLVFVTAVNAYNFIDGIDGLALTETIKNLLFLIWVLPSIDSLNSLALILVCILLPLYYFNFKKRKKVFLGDAGSLFLGGINVLFILHLLNPDTTLTHWDSKNRLLIGGALLFYPLFDLIRVVFIRLKQKKSPFAADQNHIHHWFLDRGYSHLQATLILGFSGALLLSLIHWI